MFSRLQRRRSNLQDLGRLSKSCPAVDSPAKDDTDSDFLSSSASQSESSEDASPPVTRAEKQLARQSLLRAKKREVEQKRNLEENKISMDDYLGKQALFRVWLLEEQKKQAKDLSSPKRKTYFKMFVRLWNKRHLPEKYYESRLSHHMDEDEEKASGEMILSPLNNCNHPKFSLIQNSPALDPSIFPHTIDLSSDSIALGTPATPFSTFGKSAPSSALTPIRFSAQNVGGSTARTSIFREKKVCVSSSSKENATPSLPVRATISPRKRISSSKDRTLDRISVSWSPQGQYKMNAVNAPRCPSPFSKEISTVEPKEEKTKAMCGDFSLPQKVSTFSRFSLQYEEVKDCISSSNSPTYAEIPFENASQCFSSHGSQPGAESVAKQAKGKGHRRRSRSLDEIPTYAIPSRSGKKRQWSQHQAALDENCSESPPPLPPKRFDPHVEGLGIPFSPLPVVAVTNQPPVAASGELACDNELGKKSSKKLFKGKLPWFSKKLSSTSRRRSRSCEVLSPAPHMAGERSRVLAQGESVGSKFPLMELERSPTLSRRVFDHRPHNPPTNNSQKIQLDQKSQLKDKAYFSQKAQLEERSLQNMHLAHFELTEYASSPFRAPMGERTSPPSPQGNFKRTKSIRRRRSKSLEQIRCSFMEPEQNRSPFLHHFPPQSSNMSSNSGQKSFQPSSTGSGTRALSPLTPQRTAATHHPTVNSSGTSTVALVPSGQLDGCDLSSQQGSLYHEVKADIKNQLSHMISKMQETSKPESFVPQSRNTELERDTSAQVRKLQSSSRDTLLRCEDMAMDIDISAEITELQSSSQNIGNTFPCATEVETSMEVIEMRSSPKRLGQAENRENVDEPEDVDTPYKGFIRAAAAKYLQTGQMASNSKELSTCPACSHSVAVLMPQSIISGQHDPQNFDNKDPDTQTSALQNVVIPEGSGQDIENLDSAELEADPAASYSAESEPESASASLHVASLSQLAASRELELVQQLKDASAHTDTETLPEYLVHEGAADADTDKCPANITVNTLHTVIPHRTMEPVEVPSRKETTRPPVNLTDVAFSEPVPSAQQVGLCQPLNTNLPSFQKTQGSIVNCRILRQHRRRSRSVGEVNLPRIFSSAKSSQSHDEEVETCFNAAEPNVTFAPNVSDFINSKFPKFEATPDADTRLKVVSSSTTMCTSTGSESTNIYPDVMDSLDIRQPVSEQMLQVTVSQKARKMPQQSHKPIENPQQTELIKKPPPVAEKPRPYNKNKPDGPATQQSADQEEGIPSVKKILQKFGGSIRTNRQPNRRRSRSVGDMSTLHSEGSTTISMADAETNGFSNVRAFWDRLRGKGGETDQPVVTLQRKPSTLRRLQQQLRLNEEKPGIGKNEANGKESDDQQNPFRLDFPNETQIKGQRDSTPDLDKPAHHVDLSIDTMSKHSAACEEQEKTHSLKGHLFHSVGKENTGSPASPFPSQENTTANKVQETGGDMPVKTSPFITVRRQASRKRNEGSPCFQSTPAQNTHATESPLSSRDRNVRKVTSDDLITCANPDQLLPSKKENETLTKPVEELKKISKGPPPKLLPKPTKQPLSLKQKGGDAACINPQVALMDSPVQLVPAVGRNLKRRSEETDGLDVPKKLNVVTATSEKQANIRAAISQNVRFAKCYIDDNTTHSNGSSPVKHINSARDETRTKALPRRGNREREMELKSPSVSVRVQGQEMESQNKCPLVKRKSSGKEQKDSSMVKRLSTGKEAKATSSAVRRGSSGKEPTARSTSTTSKRRSNGRVSVVKSSSIRSQEIMVNREGGSASRQVNRNNSRRGKVNTPQSERNVASMMGRQNPTLQAIYSCSPAKCSGSTNQENRSTLAAKRCNSTRGEPVTPTSTSCLVKRFNSLRNDTTSSSAKRRSGHGHRVSVGGPKRTSTGRGRVKKESSCVRRSSIKSQENNENDHKPQGGTSITGSFRNHNTAPPQSPTFIRITECLGAFDPCNNSSDDDNDNENVLGIGKFGGQAQPKEVTNVLLKGQQGSGAESDSIPAQCYLPSAAGHKSGPEIDSNEVETDTDFVSEVLEAIEDKERKRKKKPVISTLV